MNNDLVIAIDVDAEYVGSEGINPLTYSLNDHMRELLRTRRPEIEQWLTTTCDIDPNEFEGGIDDWWGLGSVFLFELGLKFQLNIDTCEQFVFTISR